MQAEHLRTYIQASTEILRNIYQELQISRGLAQR